MQPPPLTGHHCPKCMYTHMYVCICTHRHPVHSLTCIGTCTVCEHDIYAHTLYTHPHVHMCTCTPTCCTLTHMYICVHVRQHAVHSPTCTYVYMYVNMMYTHPHVLGQCLVCLCNSSLCQQESPTSERCSSIADNTSINVQTYTST